MIYLITAPYQYYQLLVELPKEHCPKKLCSFIENNLFNNSQKRFRRARSRESARLQFVSNIYKYLDNKEYVAGVFIYLTKAFGTLDHNILLKKLDNNGVRGVLLQFVNSYLSINKVPVGLL